MKYKALIFDLGGVVLTSDWHYECPEKFQEYSNYFGIDYDKMEKGWKASWSDFLKGKTTEDEFWKSFLETAGGHNIDVEHAKTYIENIRKKMRICCIY